MNSTCTDTFHDDSVCLPISHNFLYFQAMLRILGESGLIGESDRIGLLQQAASAAKTTPTSATTTTAAPSITTRRSTTFFSGLDTAAAKKGKSGKGKEAALIFGKEDTRMTSGNFFDSLIPL